MVLDEWVYRGGYRHYDRQIQLLATQEMAPEKWSSSGNSYDILLNYIRHTFDKLSSERDAAPKENKNEYIYEGVEKACFNTGLHDKAWQPIYFYCELNTIPNRQKWYFKGFYNSYTIKFTGLQHGIYSALRRPNYFEDPSLLVFDVKLPIVPQWQHIIEETDNFLRIPEMIRINGSDFCRTVIDGAIAKSMKRIEANYKTAVPQWYRGGIQLLVPLYLTNNQEPDLALACSLAGDKTAYYGHTCLTLDMAYNNARLITRPESFWLK